MNKTVNLQPAPGYYLVEPLEIKPSETFGKSKIINPNADTPIEKFHQIEERFDEHPWQAIVVAKGASTAQMDMVFNIGDTVYLKTDINKKNFIVHKETESIYIYIQQGDIICKDLNPVPHETKNQSKTNK